MPTSSSRRPRFRIPLRPLRVPLRATSMAVLLVGICTLVRAPAAAQQLEREISGWYNDAWNATSHASYMAHAYMFSEINPFWYDLGSQTDLALSDRTISERAYAYSLANVTDAHDNGDLVIPSISDHEIGQIDAILASATATQALINNLVGTAQQRRYDGFDLDFERGTPNARAQFTAFVEALATALHAAGKSLTVTIRPASTASEELAEMFDYAGLGASSVDRLRIMGYDHNFEAGANVPGPIGPLPWLRSVLSYALASGIPSSKIQLGVHNYAWTWKRSGSRWVLQTPHETYQSVVQKAGAGGWQQDAVAAEAWKQYTYAGKTYLSYVGTADTVAARLGLADEFDLAGLAFWVLGREDPAIYDALCAHFAASCTPQPVLLSADKPATASSQYSAAYGAQKAVDGNLAVGWLAAPSESVSTLRVDLLASHALRKVRIHWGSYDWSIAYDVQMSNDGSQWTTVHHESNNADGGVDEIELQQASGRYVRLRCSGPKSDSWSYEVFELQVFGMP